MSTLMSSMAPKNVILDAAMSTMGPVERRDRRAATASSPLKKGDGHFAATRFFGDFCDGSEPVPVFQQAVREGNSLTAMERLVGTVLQR